MAKKRYLELDFVRAISAVIVVCYHFSCACDIFDLQGFSNILYLYPNGKWGETAVSVFFMLSGAAMIYNYENRKLKIGQYYKKRWLSLFPMFYLMWLIMYVMNTVTRHDPFWGGEPKLMLLSLIGFDGFFYYLQSNYHSIGEWFLGDIIILYALFPLLKVLFERYRWITTALLAFLWCLIFQVDWFTISTFHNPITCICSFWIGMLLMKYREKWVKGGLGFGAIFLLFCIWKLPVNETIGMNLTAVPLFCFLFWIGKWVMEAAPLRVVINSISRNSYGIFLTHHVIIDAWVKTERYGQISLVKNILWMLAALLAAYISAVFLRETAEALQKRIGIVVKALSKQDA